MLRQPAFGRQAGLGGQFIRANGLLESICQTLIQRPFVFRPGPKKLHNLVRVHKTDHFSPNWHWNVSRLSLTLHLSRHRGCCKEDVRTLACLPKMMTCQEEGG